MTNIDMLLHEIGKDEGYNSSDLLKAIRDALKGTSLSPKLFNIFVDELAERIVLNDEVAMESHLRHIFEIKLKYRCTLQQKISVEY